MTDTTKVPDDGKKVSHKRQFTKKLMIAVNDKGQRMVLYFFAIALLFVLFGDAITDGKPQYSIAIASAFMGCIITVIITYILLNKQTENELDRERNARILEEKIKVYDEILTIINSVLNKGKITTKTKLKLQLVNLKLVQIASLGVIKTFQSFSGQFNSDGEDGAPISNIQLPILLKALLSVCVEIREDIDPRDARIKVDEKNELLESAKATIEIFKITIKDFAEKCKPNEIEYFEKIKGFIESHPELLEYPGKIGVSIKKLGKPIVWYYPITKTTPNNFIFHIDNLSEEAKNILKESKNANLNMKRSPLKLEDVPVERLIKLLEVA